LDLGAHLQPGDHGPRWTDEERALLGTAPAEVIAAQIGRPTNAVCIRRTRRGITSACDRRRRRQGTRSCGGVLD
jgi:hypothetical protein